MKLIYRYKVCGLEHKVYLVDDVRAAMAEEFKEYTEAPLEGVYMPEHKTVLIRDSLPPLAFEEVFYHELGHSIHITCQVELNEQQNQALALAAREVINSLELVNERKCSPDGKRTQKSNSKPRSSERFESRQHLRPRWERANSRGVRNPKA